MARRTEITIETSRRVIVRHRHSSRQGWCEECLSEVRMLTPEEAATLLNVSSRSIYRGIEAGSIHFSESSGTMFVCAQSLDHDIQRNSWK